MSEEYIPYYEHVDLMGELGLTTKSLPNELKGRVVMFNQRSGRAKKAELIQELQEESAELATDIDNWYATHGGSSDEAEPTPTQEEVYNENNPPAEPEPEAQEEGGEVEQEAQPEPEPEPEVVAEEKTDEDEEDNPYDLGLGNW